MTTHSSNSLPNSTSSKTKEPNERLRQLEEDLRKKGVEPRSLAVFYAGNDIIIGELDAPADPYEVGPRIGTSNSVLNPMRFCPIRQMDRNGGLNVSCTLIDMDMCDGGILEIVPHMTIHLGEGQSDGTRMNYYSLVLGFLDMKMRQRAEKAGIVTDIGQTPKNVR